MILIADGGSTKIDWVLISKIKELKRFTTTGLNPTILSSSIIKENLYKINEFESLKGKIKAVYFYGAGCGTEKDSNKLKTIFKAFFDTDVYIKEDIYAAAYATFSKKPCIVSIIGTGSNAAYYDGNETVITKPSLGYIFMDEASGNYFGRKLIQDYYYNKMPINIKNKFSEKYDVTPDEIKNNIYRKESPNMYLATFAKFMYDYKHQEYINNVLKEGFKLFINNKIRNIDNFQNLPLHFIGSIAFHFNDILIETILKEELLVGNIIQKPIDNLIKYHQNQLI